MAEAEPEAGQEPALVARSTGKKGRRIIVLCVVVVLVAAAFGGGYLWGEVRIREAAAAWKSEREKLQATISENAQSLAVLRSTRALWIVDGRISEVLADLADSNFGLARDAADAARLALQKEIPDLRPEQRAALAPLEQILKEAGQSAAALSPDAKVKARAARVVIRAAMEMAFE